MIFFFLEYFYCEISRFISFNNNILIFHFNSIVFHILETMRMYPPATMISRRCVRDYKLPDSELTIPKGMLVFVSPIGVHYDSEYYENPEQFNPDNFTDEQRTKRHQYTYLPFGEGPRICIGKFVYKFSSYTFILNSFRLFKDIIIFRYYDF